VKHTRSTLALAALFAVSGLQAVEAAKTEGGTQPAAPEKSTRLATVNGKTYSLGLFEMFYGGRLQAMQAKNTPEMQTQALNDFMTMVVAAQEAEKLKLDKRDDVKTALELQRLQILSNATIAFMAQKEKVSDAELKKAYDQLAANAKQTRYKARHILVKTKAEAERLIKKLESGADFQKLAKDDSIAPNAADGGELGWVDANQIPKPLAEALAKLKPGQYGKEPVRTQFGWHVVELEDTSKAEPPSLDDVKPQLTDLLKRQKAIEALVKLRDKTVVDVNPEVVKMKKDAGSPEKNGSGKK
jgi:peptidyl-prolyl cis-trans isomerase C